MPTVKVKGTFAVEDVKRTGVDKSIAVTRCFHREVDQRQGLRTVNHIGCAGNSHSAGIITGLRCAFDAAQSQLADYSTEWTAVFDRSTKSVTYYHRGGFKKGYIIYL